MLKPKSEAEQEADFQKNLDTLAAAADRKKNRETLKKLEKTAKKDPEDKSV